MEVLRGCAEDQDLTLHLVTAEGDLYASVAQQVSSGRLKESSGEFAEHRRNAGELLVLMSAHVKVVEHITGLKRIFIGWLKNKDDALLNVTAALIIGNVACDEKSCSDLIADGTATVLINLLKANQVASIFR